MNNQFDRDTFERVFSDAHVIDIDLSRWDKRISFWVLADHYENWSHRCPLVVVDFVNVHEIHWKMPELRLEDDEHHLQWVIYSALIEETTSLRFELSGSPSSPIFVIACESVEIRQMPIEIVDAVAPGWNRPYSGFARPNLERLVRMKYE